MKLILTNNLDKKSYEFTVIDSGSSRINYKVNVTLEPGMPDGDYDFKLFDNNKLVSMGLAQIGDYVPETTAYAKTENGYIQYES